MLIAHNQLQTQLSPILIPRLALVHGQSVGMRYLSLLKPAAFFLNK